MKSKGRDNSSMMNQFVQNRKSIQDSSGIHVPFVGVKRKTDEISSTTSVKDKKPKTRRSKTGKGYDMEGPKLQTDEGQRAAIDDLASGTYISFFILFLSYTGSSYCNVC